MRQDFKVGPSQARGNFLRLLGACALICVPLAFSTYAGQPVWGDLAGRLIVTGNYDYYQHYSNQRPGIWSFDSANKSFRLRAPLFERWGRLTGLDDRLVFFGFPADYEFDGITFRLLRRYRMITAPGGGGWNLLGPYISETEAKAIGAVSGRYGFIECGAYHLSSEGQGRCEPFSYPGLPADQVDSGDPLFTMLLMHRTGDPLANEVSLVRKTYDSWTAHYSQQLMSFDPGRGGFWLADDDRVRFLPIEGGTLLEPIITIQPLPPPLDKPKHEVGSLFYHSTQHRFFGIVGAGETTKFVSLTDSLHLETTFFEHSVYSPSHYADIPRSFASLSSTPPENYEQLIPIIAHAPGRKDTFWVSDLWLYNPSSEPTTVTIQRVVKPDSTRTLTMQSHQSMRIPDALTWIGGGSTGDGTQHDALVLTSPYHLGEQLVAVARVYTPSNDDGEKNRGGSMGHGVPTVPSRWGYSNHLSMLYDYFGPPGDQPSSICLGGASFVIIDRREPGRFRHNVGIINQSDTEQEFILAWSYLENEGSDVLPQGALQKVTVRPHSVKIQNIEELFPTNVMTQPMAKVAIAGPPAVIWSSMADNRTGDVTFVPFTMIDMVGMADQPWTELRAAIPVVGRLPGSNGTVWTTDLYKEFFNGGMTPTRKIFFHPTWPGRNCGGVLSAGGELRTESTVFWPLVSPDVLNIFPACDGDTNVRGALEFYTGSWMSTYARTYTTRPDGGTYGEMLPLYPYEGWPVQHFAGIEIGTQFRVNIGLYNGNKLNSITHRLTLYRADGTLYAQNEITLKPWESMQERIEKMLGVPYYSIPPGTYGLTVLPLDDKDKGIEGRSWAYVSLADNVTGDPTNWW